jgi:hypothetical protein
LAFPRVFFDFSGISGFVEPSPWVGAGFAGFFRWLGDSPPAGNL